MSARPSSLPTRTCVGCGARDEQAALVRLQLDADGELVPVARAHRGRSAYVHGTERCAGALAKTRLLRRSLRQDVDKGKREALIQRLAAMPPAEVAGRKRPL
jgi:predicted RNA-binding protein YlxR (DUF448 family)